jgi:hypothetical protein
MRCAWLADRKWTDKTMDCYRPVKVDTWMANFLKPMEYRNLWVRAWALHEEMKKRYTEGSDSEDLRDGTLASSESASSESGESESGTSDSALSESGSSEKRSEESSEVVTNWWSEEG